MDDFVDLLQSHLSREQVKNLIYDYVEKGIIENTGIGKGRKYYLGKKAEDYSNTILRILELGFETMVQKGEISINYFKELNK